MLLRQELTLYKAEACVTSGGCNNFLGGDASQNGYTGEVQEHLMQHQQSLVLSH